jgi:adenylate kinase family enzyme
MKKIAIFGNAGGGKSTLARHLAEATGLPLFPTDKMKYRPGGAEVPHDEYLKAHAALLSRDEWIIDGFGCFSSAWQRFAAADTLIHIDLPLFTHAMWVTKRLLTGVYKNPEGWPENSPILKGSLNSYRVLLLCHCKLTPAYRQLVADSSAVKTTYHLKSPRDIERFVRDIRHAYSRQ